MSVDFDPYAAVNAKLIAALVINEPLGDLVDSYTTALKHRIQPDIDSFGASLDTALKDAGFEYLERIEAKRMLQEEAAAAREDGKRATLRRQVAERHEGR